MTKKRRKVKTRHEKKEGEGITKSVLKGIIPEIGGLVERLEGSSEAFRKRLKEIDREVEERLKEQSLKRASSKVDIGYRVRAIRKKEEPTRPKMITKERKIKLEELKEKEPLIDVFDEKDKIRIIAELPGVKEGDIKVILKRNELTISGDKYHKKMKLPYMVRKKISKTFRHGILEIILNKKKV